MTTKRAILMTLAISASAMVLGLGSLLLFVNPASRRAVERAAMLGQGFALLCLIPIGAVWLMWAMRVRREREARERQR